MGCDPFPVILVSFEDLSTDGESVERDRERERSIISDRTHKRPH